MAWLLECPVHMLLYHTTMGALLKLEALGKLSHFIENRWAFGALMEPKGRGWESSKDAAPKIEKKSSQK